MIEGPFAKIGIAGLLIGVVWALNLGVEKAGGGQLVRQGGVEGALVPEVPTEIATVSPERPLKHSALVAVSIPKVSSIDPGSVQVITPGLTLEDTNVRPILEFKRTENPKPRSILVLLDNSRSMVVADGSSPASDPDYRRLEACRTLLDALPSATDRVSLACFPCRNSVEDQLRKDRTDRPYELLTTSSVPSEAAPLLDSLRGEENGSTPLYRAVTLATHTLLKSPAGSQRILVLLTDGKDTDRDPGGLTLAVQSVKAAGIDTYAIGLGPGADVGILQQLTPNVLKADDAKALNRSFRQILLQMSREVTQIDLDVFVGRVGKPIPKGQPVEITFRSGGKLYTTRGKTQ